MKEVGAAAATQQDGIEALIQMPVEENGTEDNKTVIHCVRHMAQNPD
jgi:hypothetical protein